MENKSGSFMMPTSYFGISLGLFSLGLAYRYAAKAAGVPFLFSEVLLILAATIWIVFIGIYIYRLFYKGDTAYAELKNPIQGCFISLIPITTILLGVAVIPLSRIFAEILIFGGIIGQLIFSSYHTGGMWRGIHSITATTPVIYLPTIAAGFASAIGAGALGYDKLGMLFFGAGMFSWISFEAVTLQRLRTEELASKIRPVIGIQLAPAFVACAAYLSINGGKVDVFAQMLIGYGLLNFFFLVRLFYWVIEDGFTTGFWAFSFGLGSMANTGMHMFVQYKGDIVSTIGLIMFIVASILIALLLLITLKLIFKGKFFVK